MGIVENLRRKRVFLEEAGARCIVMPCHVSHAWYGKISVGCKQPFLHIAECVAMELREARFRHLEVGCAVKIGVIATEDTLMAGFYQEKLQDQVILFSSLLIVTQKSIGLEMWMHTCIEYSTLNEGSLRFESVTSCHVGF